MMISDNRSHFHNVDVYDTLNTLGIISENSHASDSINALIFIAAILQAIIYLIQAILLYVTINISKNSSRIQTEHMTSQLQLLGEQAKASSKQLEHLSNSLKTATTDSVFNKLTRFYEVAIENPDSIRSIWRNSSDSEEIKEKYISYLLIDLLFQIYLSRDSLPSSLGVQTWSVWAKLVIENKLLRQVLDEASEQYPDEFVSALEAASLKGGGPEIRAPSR